MSFVAQAQELSLLPLRELPQESTSTPFQKKALDIAAAEDCKYSEEKCEASGMYKDDLSC